MSTRERLSAEDRKRQICGAAKEVFLSTGFENATMEDIMKAAGLSKGGLYHHYKSTHDILYDIMMMGNEYRNEVIMEFVSANSNLSKKEIIVELLTDKILDRNEYKSLYAMFLLECKKNEKYRKLYERLRRDTCENYKKPAEKLGIDVLKLFDFPEFEMFMNGIILAIEYLDNGSVLSQKRQLIREFITCFVDKHLI